MTRSTRTFTISCPRCGEKRLVSYSVYDHIRAGRSKGLCTICRHQKYQSELTNSLLKTRFHRIWIAMRQRCNNPNNDGYKHYGGRGIKVCKRWDSFENFIQDMYPTYSDSLSIDRIDNNGDYEPANCRWSTRAEQGLNTRRNRWVTIDGKTQTVSEWAKQLDVNQTRFYGLMNRGISMEEAITFVLKRRYTLNGKTQSLAKWSRELGFNQRTVRKRLARGIPFNKAIL